MVFVEPEKTKIASGPYAFDPSHPHKASFQKKKEKRKIRALQRGPISRKH